MRNFTNGASIFTKEEIETEARRLRAAEKRERYRRDPSKQREATRRYWERKALASLQAAATAEQEVRDGDSAKN